MEGFLDNEQLEFRDHLRRGVDETAARAGSLLSKRVLVTGCAPIGTLSVMAASALGAREIVATDVMDAVLGKDPANRSRSNH